MKRIAEPGGSLLDSFGEPMSGGFNPLLVSEGSADGKLATIYRSDYLTFAYASLSQHEGPLCIFGHSLSDSDRHIVDAIRASKSRTLAVSIRPGSAVEVRAKKAAFIPGTQLDVVANEVS